MLSCGAFAMRPSARRCSPLRGPVPNARPPSAPRPRLNAPIPSPAAGCSAPRRPPPPSADGHRLARQYDSDFSGEAFRRAAKGVDPTRPVRQRHFAFLCFYCCDTAFTAASTAFADPAGKTPPFAVRLHCLHCCDSAFCRAPPLPACLLGCDSASSSTGCPAATQCLFFRWPQVTANGALSQTPTAQLDIQVPPPHSHTHTHSATKETACA